MLALLFTITDSESDFDADSDMSRHTADSGELTEKV